MENIIEKEAVKLKKNGKKSYFALFRKVHIYSFGYFKWPSIFASILFVIISITGVLYNHHHDFEFLEKGRMSTEFLPDSYQERLDRTRKAQGLEDLFPDEARRMPIMWLIKDLHTGDFFGPWGRILYDLVCLSLITLAITGCYLFLKIETKTNKKRQGDT
jgi:uncharacterized iron-regulated membrane protein